MPSNNGIEDGGKSSPRDLTHHLSRSTRKRVPNVLKDYYRFLRVPGMGSLAGGLPFPGYFPFDQLDASVVSPQKFLCESNQPKRSCGKGDEARLVRINRRCEQADPFRRIDLDTALQYGTAQGFPPLYAWLKTLVNSVYHPNIPYQGKADVVITSGSADGLSKVYDILFNEWDETVNDRKDREGLMVEEMVYAPPIAQIRHKDVNIVPVRMDAEGMQTAGRGGLLDVLENWDYAKGKRPHVIYLIPTGQNPTSGVLSLPRRREIYEICSRFDVIIIEDDPYWNLLYSSAQSLSATFRGTSRSADFPVDIQHNYLVQSLKGSSTGYEFLDQLIPSFLSLDTDGRVIRLDTLSKTIAPGCRLGWITAQPGLCEQLIRVTDATTQQPSGFVQAIVTQLLSSTEQAGEVHSSKSTTPDRHASWGVEGWVKWLECLRDNYQRRMITMATIFEQNRFLRCESSEIEMFSFNWPMGGMFLWMKIHLDNHPLRSLVVPQRLMLALWICCTQHPYRVLMNPGKDFAASDSIKEAGGYSYLRFCFAAVEESALVSKSRSFIEACRRFWGMDDINDINQVLREEDARRANTEMKDDDVERLIFNDG